MQYHLTIGQTFVLLTPESSVFSPAFIILYNNCSLTVLVILHTYHTLMSCAEKRFCDKKAFVFLLCSGIVQVNSSISVSGLKSFFLFGILFCCYDDILRMLSALKRRQQAHGSSIESVSDIFLFMVSNRNSFYSITDVLHVNSAS